MIVTPNGWGLIICKCDHVGDELSHLIKTLQDPTSSPSINLGSFARDYEKSYLEISLWKESDQISPSWK